MEEKWVRVPGFSNYEISNLGKVEKVGKTKRIPMKVSRNGNYLYCSLTGVDRVSKQISVKQVMDACFDEHVYSDHSADNLEDETWKDVVGWENSYEVSNLGRIRTKERIATNKRGFTSAIRTKLKVAYIDGDGYQRISLYEDGRTQLLGVHRVVASAFIPNPDGFPQVNHKNGDKADNRVENLEWVTNTQNIQHSIQLGLRDPKSGRRPIVCIDDNTHFDSVASLHRHIGGSYNELVHLFNSSNSNVICIDGKQYKHDCDGRDN